MFACSKGFHIINFLSGLQFNFHWLCPWFDGFLSLRLTLRVGVGVTAAVGACGVRVALTSVGAEVEVPGGETLSRRGARHGVQGEQSQLFATVRSEYKNSYIKSNESNIVTDL